jgi:hypothetical protein
MDLRNDMNRTAREVTMGCIIYVDIANTQIVLELPVSNEDHGTISFLSLDFARMDLRKRMENFNLSLNFYWSNNCYFDPLREFNRIPWMI